MDVSYGGENGFNQAIELAAETLSNVKVREEEHHEHKRADYYVVHSREEAYQQVF